MKSVSIGTVFFKAALNSLLTPDMLHAGQFGVRFHEN